MSILKTDLENILRSGPLSPDPIYARYEHAASCIVYDDKFAVSAASEPGISARNMDLHEFCVDITSTAGKDATTEGHMRFQKRVFTHFFKEDSVCLRICTADYAIQDVPNPNSTLSVHRVTKEKQLDELGKGGTIRTEPRRSAGEPLAIRHPAYNLGKDDNVELVHECMMRMFRDRRFARKFMEAKMAKLDSAAKKVNKFPRF